MKKLATVMLCLATLLAAFFLGGFAKAHRMSGEMFDVKHRLIEACRARQAILMDVDRASWTDPQRQAFDNMCATPNFLQNDYLESRGFAADAILFLGIAIAVYLGMMIYRALKPGKR